MIGQQTAAEPEESPLDGLIRQLQQEHNQREEPAEQDQGEEPGDSHPRGKELPVNTNCFHPCKTNRH